MSGCMTLHPASTGYEPNVPNADANVDTSGARFAPAVDLTHDNDDAKSHMSDIPLQVPASAKFFVEQLGIGHALTSRRRPRAKCSQSSTNTKSNRIRSLTITESPKVYFQSLDIKKRFKLVAQRARDALAGSARNGSTSSSINKENFLLPLVSEQNLVNTLARNDEVHNYKLQMQVLDFHEDEVTCYRDSLRRQIKLLKTSEKTW